MNKKGNILVIFMSLALVIMVFLFFNAYVLYMQLDLQVYSVRRDMFYIVQNSFFSLDKNELKYYSYKVDEKILLEKINKIVYLNYKDKVSIESIKYDYLNNKVNINYCVKFYPVVFKSILGESKKIKLIDNIKLKNMEV